MKPHDGRPRPGRPLAVLDDVTEVRLFAVARGCRAGLPLEAHEVPAQPLEVRDAGGCLGGVPLDDGGDVARSGRYDLAIVGSGAAGFSAAIAATRRNRRVVMVERGVLGGTCVKVGCIPSKSLLVAAEARYAATRASFPGIATTGGPVDMPSLPEGEDEVVSDLRRERYEDLARDYGWDLVRDEAVFSEGPVLTVGGRPLEAAHYYLVATGSRPWVPRGRGCQLHRAGVRAALARPGINVVLPEALEGIAPFEEPEISEALASVLEDGRLKATRANVMRVQASDGLRLVTARLAAGELEFAAEHVLVATARRPAIDRLDPGRVGVEVGLRGEVAVDEHLRTADPRVWAAGESRARPSSPNVAGAQGDVVVANAFDDAERTIDYRALPRVTFTCPNAASVGLTDAQAREQGIDCECRVVSLEYVPRAIVNRDTRAS